MVGYSQKWQREKASPMFNILSFGIPEYLKYKNKKNYRKNKTK